MEPSPLLSRCLERALLQEQSEAEAARESEAVDLLCLLSALAHRARLGEERMRAKPESHTARVADTVARFHRECRKLFGNDASTIANEAPLYAFGRECAGALVVPFSDHRKKAAAFVADTVAGFAPVAERLLPLWSQAQTIRPALMHALAVSPSAPRVLLEDLALEAYRRAPPPTRRPREDQHGESPAARRFGGIPAGTESSVAARAPSLRRRPGAPACC